MSEVDGKIWNMCVKMAHSTVEGNIKKDGEGILEEYVLDVCLGCCWLNPTHKAASRKYRFIHFFIYIFTDSKLAKKKKKKPNLILDLISKHLFSTSLTETEVFLFILDRFKPLRIALSTSNISLLGFLAEGERRKKIHLDQICSY